MKSTVKMVLHFNNLDFKNKQLYHYVLKINFDKLQERKSFKRFFKLKKLFNEIVVKNLLAYNLWEVFMKQTISKRLCNIYNILLPKSTEYIKIFYRRPFIYEPRVAMQSRRKYKKNEQFVLTGIVKLFYVMYSYKQLKKIAIKAKLQNGVIEHNYISFIESKLPSYVYRMSFFPTLFDSLDFVKGGNV
jgi:hypothetical protein